MVSAADPFAARTALKPVPLEAVVHLARRTARGLASTTSALRVLPDYLIVGAKRSGTTSLHKYVVDHPAVHAPNVPKSSHFFDVQFARGWCWYRSHFPTVFRREWERRVHHRQLLVGEASPYYVFHPLALERIAAALPNVRLILLARDPVDRAYSHYHYEVARGFEVETIDRALDLEPERLAGEVERIRADPAYDSFPLRHHSYASRGLYIEQVQRLWALFPKEHVLVLCSEGLFTDPHAAMRLVTDFLGLEPLATQTFGRHKANTYRDMAERVRRRLAEHFAEPNQRLYRALGVDFGWTAPRAG